MNELTTFKFKDQQVEVIMINGKPHFIGSQVANILGYENGSRDINRHVNEKDRKVLTFDEIQKYQIGSFASPRGLTVINKSGLYSLILSSKLESAKEFKYWVTSEVLPSIEETGKYELKPKSDAELVAVGLQAASRIIDQLRGEITTLKPKAEAYNILLETGGLVRFRDLVQKLRVHFKINERVVREWLIENRWFYRIRESDNHSRFKPFTSVIDAGYVRVKDEIYKNYHHPQYFFTRLGEEVLIKEFDKEFSLLKAESMNLFYIEE